MKNIYAVNAGSYSDYRIIAIFSTMEKANEFMAAVPSRDYNDVEIFDLDPNTSDLIKRGYAIWRINMLKDGTTESITKSDADIYSVTRTGTTMWWRTKAPFYKDKGVPDCLISTVWAKTEKQAVKIANEHRLKMIALGQWD